MNLNDWVRKPTNEDEFVSLKPFVDFTHPADRDKFITLRVPTVIRQELKKATDEGGQ